jgi:hypothetical protein
MKGDLKGWSYQQNAKTARLKPPPQTKNKKRLPLPLLPPFLSTMLATSPSLTIHNNKHNIQQRQQQKQQQQQLLLMLLVFLINVRLLFHRW